MHRDREDEKRRSSEQRITLLPRGEDRLEHPARTEQVFEAVRMCPQVAAALREARPRILRAQKGYVLIGEVLEVCSSNR